MTRFVGIQSTAFPNVFLRIDGSQVSQWTQSGSGTVNCQYGMGAYETLRLIPQDGNPSVFAIGSTLFPNAFLRVEPGLGGGPHANCQFWPASGQITAPGAYERFKLIDYGNGRYLIQSDYFPGAVLSMNGTGVTQWTANGGGYANTQKTSHAQAWEIFTLREQPELADAPLVNWRHDLWSSRYVAPGSNGCVAFGRSWIGSGATLLGYGALQGEQQVGFDLAARVRFLRPYGNLIAAGLDDGTIWTIDPKSFAVTKLATVGAMKWMGSDGNALYTTGAQGLYLVLSAAEAAITPDGPLHGPYTDGVLFSSRYLADTPCVVRNEIFVPAGGVTITMPLQVTLPLGPGRIDVLDSRSFMQVAASLAVDSRPGPVFSDGSRLCVATANNTVYVFDVATKQQLNTFKFDAAAFPVVKGDFCYAALATGAVKALDLTTRQRSIADRQLPGAPTAAPLITDKGTLFYPTANQIVAIGTAPGGEMAQPLTLDTYPSPQLAGYDDGVLYYADMINASAVRLDEAIHQFFVESALIRDFDFSAGAQQPTSVPNFQVEVTLTDKDGSPRAGQLVRIFSNDTAIVHYQGEKHLISPSGLGLGDTARGAPGLYLEAVTDGSGCFRLAVPAGWVDAGGTLYPGVTTPDLLLWSPFMDKDMRVVIQPGGPLQGQLAAITKDQLRNAQGYDQKPVVANQYRGNDTVMANATKAINQTAGMVQGSMTAARKRAAGRRYCDPDCDMSVVCCVPASAPTLPVVCTQAYSFSLEDGAASFVLLSNEEASRAAAALIGRKRNWISDAWDDLKKGVAKVVNAVIEPLKEGFQATIDIGRGIFQAVVKTIREAQLLVQGILNALATAIEHVIEAVSFLFDWGAILDLHNFIKRQAADAVESLCAETAAPGDVNFTTLKRDIQDSLTRLKENADGAIASAKTRLGVESANGIRSAQPPNRNKTVGSVQDNWLVSKVSDHGIAPVTSGPSAGRARSASFTWPEFEAGAEISRIFGDFTSALGTAVSDDVKRTIGAIREDLDFSSDPGVLARSLAVLLDVARGLVDVALDVANQVIGLLIDLARALMKAALEFSRQKIEIPFFSDFYEYVTGERPTLLGMFSLLVAVPTHFFVTIAGKAPSREPAYAAGTSAARPHATRDSTSYPKGIFALISGSGQMVWGAVAGVLSALAVQAPPGSEKTALISKEGGHVLTKIRIAFTACALVVERTFMILSLFRPANVWGILSWLFPTLALAADIGFLFLSLGKSKEPGKEALVDWNKLPAIFVSVILGGLAMLLGAWGVFEETSADSWNADKALVFTFSELVGLSLVVKLGYLFVDPKVVYSCIAASSLFIIASGGVQIARGVIEEA